MPRKPARKSTAQSNRLRVIAGQWRGRLISFDDQQGLRPTGDRIRETLFNWLQLKTPASHCLDLFAGSGALGIEAASRGAAAVTLVDSDVRVARRLRAEVDKLGAGNIDVEQCSAQQFVQTVAEKIQQGNRARFDIVFIDPPFEQGSQLDMLQLCASGQLLRDGAQLYIEAPLSCRIEQHLPASCTVLKSRQGGNVRYCLLEFTDRRL